MTNTVKRFTWILLICLGTVGAACWFQFSFPRYKPYKLSIDQPQAKQIASKFLQDTYAVDPSLFQSAAVFFGDSKGDRYLQRTLGWQKAQEFVKDHQYELFYWVVRFFNDGQKEEYRVHVSSQSGRVLRLTHVIDDTAPAKEISKEEAHAKALSFLREGLNADPNQYEFYSEDAKKLEKRVDYTFVWAKKGVYVPWENKSGGGAKLLSTVTVTGDQVLAFNQSDLHIPDAFNRHIEKLKESGENLTLIFRIIYLVLLTIAVMMVIQRNHHTVMRFMKRFYVAVGVLLFALIVFEAINDYHDFLYSYPTSQSLGAYFTRAIIQSLIAPFFIVVGFIIPALAGEALRHEQAPAHKSGGLLSNVQSTFFSRETAAQIIAGYFAMVFLLGIQGLIFEMGYRHFGVWEEFSWVTQSSSALIPAFAVFLIGFKAAISEETMFRLFGINLGRKVFKSLPLAIVLSALAWGFGHTGYAIFPTWFRGLEVAFLGVLLSLFYIRFGLITVLVAHFLMNAALMSLPYLLNPSSTWNFISVVGVLLLPLGFALAAFMRNQSSLVRPLTVALSKQQEFNRALALKLMKDLNDEERKKLKKDLLANGWDPVVVESL